MSQIGLQGISKTFGTVKALDNVSLDVAEGELMTLLGPSGCGKTTLLRVVSGLEQPDTGKVLIGGEDITARPTRERPIGMVFQSYALFPNMTVRAQHRFPLEARHWPRARINGTCRRAADARASRRAGGPLSRARSPAARPSAARWRGPWRPIPQSCCLTSHSQLSMSSCGRACATRSGASSSR